MKHYPIVVSGIKASACVETGWEWAKVSIKVSHRKGQSVTILHHGGNNVWIDEYPTYTAFRVVTAQGNYCNALHAIKCCAELIDEIIIHVNLDADSKLVSKELLSILPL